MFAVAFEVFPLESGYQRYLDIAAVLRPKLDAIDGFLSVERFASITHPGWILSLSLWRDEAALVRWRGEGEHHAAQAEGRQSVFKDYRIRVIRVGDAAPGEALVGLREFPSATEGGKRFRSLVNQDKEILVLDFADAAGMRAWQEQEAPPARTLCGGVLRDYGLFERGGAPQTFPDAVRRG